LDRPAQIHGLVTDIHRFALEDGPGIRTSVFLKGCPLRCLWCHNPEAQSTRPQLSFKSDRCEHCMSCVPVCPENVHRVNAEQHQVNFELCSLQADCLPACPTGALSIIGKKWSNHELMELINRDRAYYETSGGGLTLSGGEPMNQFNFSSAVLKQAKAQNIHTCLDTSGYAPTSHFTKIMDTVDLFLFDYKASNEDQHKQLTGISNDLILRNLDFLYQAGKEIILRCPLIPGVNDGEDHLEGIVRLAQHYPGLRDIQIMPFHPYGISKATDVGMAVPEIRNSITTTEEMSRWTSFFAERLPDRITMNQELECQI